MKNQSGSDATEYVSRRRVLKGTAGSIVAVGMAGCQNEPDGTETSQQTTGGGGGATQAAQSNQQSGGKLKFAQVKSPIEFDPIVLNDIPSSEVAGMVFDPLYTYDQTTNLVPKIAADMPTVERGGQRWIVPLNTDAKFQNGDPVTAEDVAYSFTAPVKEETENAGEFNMIDTAEPVDESTVQFDLKYQFGAFKQYLPWEIVPKSVREKDKKAFNTKNPVGAGPFTFEDWTEGEFARVSRWEDYWGKPKPNLSTIEFVPVEEGTTRITTLKTGENDVVKGIPPKSWQTVKGMNNAHIDAVPGTGYFYLAFNCKQGPTADPKVREAIDYAFSMDQAVSQFVEPTGIRQYSPIPKAVSEEWNFPVDEWKNMVHEKNVDKAKSMLDSNQNVPNNWTAKIIVPPDDKREQIGVSVANGLQEAGYNAQVQRLDWGAFLEKYVSGKPSDYNMYTLGWAGSPDPDTFMYFLFAHEQIGTTNGTFYRNKSMNENIMQARRSNNRDKRRQMYIDAINTVLQDRVHVPSYNLKNSFGVRSRVNDFTAHPVNQFSIVSNYTNVSVE